MHYYLVSPLKVVHGQEATLTYHSEQSLLRGAVVAVEVGKTEVPAVVLQSVPQPTFTTKPVKRNIEGTAALPEALLRLHDWLAEYYRTHPVAVWQTMLPRGLLKTRRESKKNVSHPSRKRTQIVFNKDQQRALDHIEARPATTTLLHGVTGSGKTALYVELARRSLEAGKSVIIIVPEISLTSQLVAEFIPHFPDLILTHSTMTEATRHQAWREALHSPTPRLIIGPRSALFSPVKELGLIVIDECHEPSLKQEQSPRYSALRAAAVLSQATGARLVLGSATPAVSDYHLATQSPGSIIRLDKVARTDAIKPEVELIDMTVRSNFSRSRFLSTPLIKAIEHSLASGHQTLLFHNRRGSASTTLCENCGWNASCPRCFIPLTLHADRFETVCHVCAYRERVPTSCPDCGRPDVIHKGIGTKRVAEELARLFPAARIARFDGDNHGDETLDRQYQKLYDGDIDIIVGTQVVAKGLDLPHLRLVGVVQADSGLSLPDYYAEERVFQLLAQVAGRVGRNEHASRAIIQSYQPTHPSVQFGIKQDYDGFYQHCLEERRRGKFPPFTHLLKLTCVYKSEAAAVRAARSLAATLRRQLPPHAEIFGPTPAFYERARDTYRWQLIVKSPQRGDLLTLLGQVPPAKWQSELDPISLL